MKNRGITNIWSVLFGSLMLGCGMSLSGGCPGMVWIQIGSGVKNSGFAIFGCFAGAFVFGFIHPYIKKISFFEKNHLPEFIDEYLKINYGYIAVACGIMFLAVASVFGMYQQYKTACICM